MVVPVPPTPVSLRVLSTTATSATIQWDEPPQTILTPSNFTFFTDAVGNTWGLTQAGAVTQNGVAVHGGGGTSMLTLNNGILFGQDAVTKTWWQYSPTAALWSQPQIVFPVAQNVGYQIRYRVAGTTNWTLFANVVSVTSMTVTGLVPDTQYEMEVVASGH